jgi:anti-sigma B factor antagonist
MLNIKKITEGDITILKVSGKMLDQNAMSLIENVKKLSSDEKKKVILDLNEIELMNSCFGIGILIACLGCINRVGGKLKITKPSKKVSKLLQITKLNQVFEIYEKMDDAKVSF